MTMLKSLTNTIQYISVSNQNTAYLKLTQSYMSVISQK